MISATQRQVMRVIMGAWKDTLLGRCLSQSFLNEFSFIKVSGDVSSQQGAGDIAHSEELS